MNRDHTRRVRRDGGSGSTAATARRRVLAWTPAAEELEGRQLLSHYYTGVSAMRPVQTPGGVFTVSVHGRGYANVAQLGRGVVGLKLYGTTATTTVDVTLGRQKLHREAKPLQIGYIKVVSGQLGAIRASDATLLGTVTPIGGPVSTLQFGGLGPNARIDVGGSVDTMNLGAVDLGPNGHVKVGGDLTQTLNVGGPLHINGGQFTIGRDLTGGANVGGNLTVANHGLFAVGQDLKGTLAITGSLGLSGGGIVSVGRDLNVLNVNGNVTVDPSGGQIIVGGNLSAMAVSGFFQGKGVASPADLTVGLDLHHLIVTGGGADQGGVRGVSIDVAKSIQVTGEPTDGPFAPYPAIFISHGVFDSLITAGISIQGGGIGADGVVALLNSQFLAGVSINNITLGGDMKSDFPTNPNPHGYPTRVVAGELRSGQFLANGTVSGFDIEGDLIDSVIAASVQPYGGDGSLPPPVPYGQLPRQPAPPPGQGDGGYNTYDAPGGITGTGAGAYKNYSELSFPSDSEVVLSWNTALDPTIDDNILPGGSASVSLKGSVISTPHPAGNPDRYDFTAVLAEKTRGVFGGLQPGS